jgi:hypothetical protein
VSLPLIVKDVIAILQKQHPDAPVVCPNNEVDGLGEPKYPTGVGPVTSVKPTLNGEVVVS